MNILELLRMHLDDNNITNECMERGGWRTQYANGPRITKIRVYIKLASVGSNIEYMADMIDLVYNKATGNIIGYIRKSNSYPRSIYDSIVSHRALLRTNDLLKERGLQSFDAFAGAAKAISFNIANPRSFDRISEWIAVVSSVACEIYNGEVKHRRPFPSVKSFGGQRSSDG